eukprot:gene10411-15752_t
MRADPQGSPAQAQAPGRFPHALVAHAEERWRIARGLLADAASAHDPWAWDAALRGGGGLRLLHPILNGVGAWADPAQWLFYLALNHTGSAGERSRRGLVPHERRRKPAPPARPRRRAAGPPRVAAE